MWILLAAWVIGWGYKDLKPIHFVVLAISLLMAVIRYRRWVKLPDRSVEVDGDRIRLLPAGHWMVDEIPRAAILGKREEGRAVFIHFTDQGRERAVEFERVLFSKEDWEGLLGALREEPRVPVGS